MFDLVFRNSTRNKRYTQAFFERILGIAGRALRLKKGTYEISINLVGERRIRELNKRYRRKDAVTDVLSFPLGAEALRGYNEKALGDLFICLPYAYTCAKRENMTLDAKMAWLTVHGLLHLLGYDHERSPEDEKKMFALEKKVLRAITK